MDNKPDKNASLREIEGWVSHLTEAVASTARALERAKEDRDRIEALIASLEKDSAKYEKELAAASKKVPKKKAPDGQLMANAGGTPACPQGATRKGL